MFNNLLYLDAAATTAIISAATAVIVALGAWFRIQWRKIKKNKNTPKSDQEKEADLVITEDVSAEEKSEEKADTKKSTTENKEKSDE